MNKVVLRLSAIVVLAAIAVSACQPPNCENVDMGTCGNACCAVQWKIDARQMYTSDMLQKMLTKTLAAGGPDGRYTLKVPAEGKVPGFADLRKFKIGTDFIGQAWHTTKVKHYNDTINMKVNDNTVFAFSTSQIAGALGDNGQNYKNVISILDTLAPNNGNATTSIVFGCGKKSPQSPMDLAKEMMQH